MLQWRGGNNPQALLALITGREAVSGCCLLESEGRFGSSPAAPAWAAASPAESDPLPQGLCTFLCL